MFDLNIDHYSKDEIEDLFDLKSKVYSNSDVEKNMVELKKKIDLDSKIDSQTKENTLMFLLTAKEILLNTTNNLLTNHVIEQGDNFLIQKPRQRPTDVGYTDEPYYTGTINPVQRRTTEILVNVDSRFRDDQKSLSTDFTISFPDLIKNVISMQVKTIEEITGFLQISDQLKNNYFHYNNGLGIQKVTIPDGNYTPTTLVNALTSADTYSDNITYELVGNKIRITRSSLCNIFFNKSPNGDDEESTNLRQRLGWILGHNEETLELNNEHTFTNNVQLTRVNYASLVVDDFQNNFYQTVINSTNSYVQNSNIVARIGNVNSLKQIQNDSPERKYFGPVDLQKLKIQLVDEFGRIIILNGNELSFSILLKTQYDM